MKWSTAIFLGGGLAVLFGFMGWAFYSTRSIGFGPGGGAITVMIVAGVLGTGLLTGVLMWLAFYSSRKGYDESPKFETKPDEAAASDDPISPVRTSRPAAPIPPGAPRE